MEGALSYLEGLDENAGPDARSEAEQTVVENAREIEKLKEDLKAYEWAASLEQSGESTPVDIENALAKLFVGEPLDAAETAIASALAQARPEYFPTVEKKNPLRLGPGTLVLETDEAMSAAYTTRYSKAVLGDDLALALYNADECLAATEKSAFYAQLLLIDEEAKQAGYETPRAYFEANPEAKEAYAWVNRRADEVRQARIEAQDAEVKG